MLQVGRAGSTRAKSTKSEIPPRGKTEQSKKTHAEFDLSTRAIYGPVVEQVSRTGSTRVHPHGGLDYIWPIESLFIAFAQDRRQEMVQGLGQDMVLLKPGR